MIVYELVADIDMTTRSTSASYGLFSTYEKADAARVELNFPSYAWYAIVEREVE